MKKSKAVSLGAVLVAAAALSSSCANNDNVKRCVNKTTNVVVADSCCNPKSTTHRTGGVHPFLWYYGGRGFSTGDHVSNGSFSPVAGKSYAPANNGVSRGGFGKTGSGHSVVS